VILRFWIDMNNSEGMLRHTILSHFDDLLGRMVKTAIALDGKLPKESSVQGLMGLRDFIFEITANDIRDTFDAYFPK
jgi:hypothetical protein